MIVKGEVCTAGCGQPKLCGGACTPRINQGPRRGRDSRPTRVMMKCIGEEAGNMLPRRTRMSIHDYLRDLVNVHGDSHSCQLRKGKDRLTFDRPIECSVFRL